MRTRGFRAGPGNAAPGGRDSISHRAAEAWQTPNKYCSSRAGVFSALGESFGVIRRFTLLKGQPSLQPGRRYQLEFRKIPRRRADARNLER